MQLLDLMSVIAPQGAAKPASAGQGAAGAPGFGQLLSGLLAAQGEGAGPGAAARRAPGLLGRVAEAAGAEADKLLRLGETANPLAGLQAVVQQVLAAPEPTVAAAEAAERFGAALEARLGAAGPDARQSLAGRLERMLHRLDAAEARATGVDPSQAPEGWAEPAAFAEARKLLTDLLATVRQASAPPDATAEAQLQAATAPAVVAGQAAAQIAAGTSEAVQEPPAEAETLAQAPVAAREPALVKPRPDSKPADRDNGAVRPLRAPPEGEIGRYAEAPSGSEPLAGGAASPESAPTAPTPSAAKPAPAQAGPEALAPDAAREPVRADASSQGVAAPAVPAPHEGVRALAADAVRGSPETVAHLAAQIVKRMDGRSARFEMELHPQDLGRVDVQMRIEQDGRLNAQIAFDNPAAAADFRGRGDELRRALEQAGFQLTEDSLSFSDRQTGEGRRDFQQGGFGRDEREPSRGEARARAFREGDINARVADAAVRLEQRAVLGLDMKV
jgi:flagellar hook-length control protein FliK